MIRTRTDGAGHPTPPVADDLTRAKCVALGFLNGALTGGCFIGFLWYLTT